MTDVLSEFPAAKRLLEEKGRLILTKMGMLEETGEGDGREAEKVETKLNRLESNLDTLQTKLARLLVELESSNCKMQARVEQLEWEVAALDTQLPEHKDGEDERKEKEEGRGDGVGQEVDWEREEAEGEEEEDAIEVEVKEQAQGKDSNDVTKEGDGESSKSTKEDTERLVEGNKCGVEDLHVKERRK